MAQDAKHTAILCGYLRTPFTLANKGALASVRPDDMIAHLITGLLAKVSVEKNDIEEVIIGTAFPEGEQGYNIGRMAALIADLPETVAGSTVNRWCGSSMEAIHIAAGKIAMGAGDVFLCGGVESMSRIPMGGFNPMPNPGLYDRNPDAYLNMGETAEIVAKKYGVTRLEMEQFALDSHQKAAAADMSEELLSITTPEGEEVTKDGTIRADSTLEKMATLKPAFQADGLVTAATSSPLTDGASLVLICSEAYADAHTLPKLARILGTAVAGLAPNIMGVGPIEASRKALKRSGLTIEQMDVMELNEAFSAQAIPVIRELGIDPAKVNLEGGAIALGHPLGASGARITGKAALLLNKYKKKYALATACIGLGMGIATVLEAVNE